MYTPNKIDKLAPNQIFVFGSNLEGHHAGGAARLAHDRFGAVWGQGVGLQGQCYAIPTMHGGVETIKPYVDEFIEFAKEHKELTFLVTRIGCGIAGFKDRQIAPLFSDAMDCDNITLPREFAEVLAQSVIQTSCGEVRRVKDKWFFRFTTNEDKDLIDIPYTDGRIVDTFLIRHNGKYGIYSIPGNRDFDDYVKPNLENYSYDGPCYWMALHSEPFPYDEVKVRGMNGYFYGKIAYRIGKKWGIMFPFYIPSEECVGVNTVVPCEYDSVAEAERHLPVWENPFDRKVGYRKGPYVELHTPDGEWDYHAINREVMTDTKKQYETMPQLQEAVRHSVGLQYMVRQEVNIDQPVAKESHTQYITSPYRTFEAAKDYKGKKVAVLNFANNHSVGGSPFVAGAQEESLCRCSTLYPCLQAMYEPFYKKHQDEYGRGEIDEMGSDDLIYTPDVVVFKTDERTDPVYPRMMYENEWYKVDVITCAAPELRYHSHKPKNYEEIITRRIKKILDVAAGERVDVLILGAWGCGAFGNDIKVVSKAFYTLLENYDFETVEFAMGSTRFFEYFPKGKVVS